MRDGSFDPDLRRPSPSRRAALAGLAAAAVAAGPVTAQGRSLDREAWIEADAARLYLLVRGRDAKAPVLLWLHGGPGGAERPLFRLYNGDLERQFVVAYLDQRGAGRSFNPAADVGRLTIAQHLADLGLVIDHLRRTLGQDRIILLGHSWGSALGLLYAKAHPEKVAAFLGVGQVTSTVADQQAQLAFAEGEAAKRGDKDAVRTLADVGAPPFSAKTEAVVQGFVDRYGGYFHRRPNMAATMLRGVGGGLVSPWGIARIIHANNVSLAAMSAELRTLDLTRDVQAVAVPVAFLLGRYDHQTDSGLAAAYFQRLSAQRKLLIWFENSAHNVPFEEPAAFNAAVPRTLRSLGVLAAAAAVRKEDR